MKYKRYDNCLFRHDESGKVELCQNGKWIPYDDDDTFDVKMMGTPMDQSEADEWEAEMKGRQSKQPSATQNA